jgi:perosamine synthetase
MSIMIPVYKPSLNGNEKKYVIDCLDSTWISSKGQYIEKFESGFKEYIGIKNATAVCNGTVALHLALIALGIGPGDEVIVPTLTYIASVNTIKYCGATPIFVDSNKETWQIDLKDVKQKLSPNTKAVIAVHLYGHPCDLKGLRRLCDENSIFLVEDCAEAIGSKYEGKHVGTFGDISTFSFFGNKTITTGEGGMVVTNDTTLHNRAVHFKGQGLAYHRQYWHDVIGYNYRMTNICAAIGLAQLEQIDEILLRKSKIAKIYFDNLSNEHLEFHLPIGDVFHSYWMVTILTKLEENRDKLREYLSKNNIETRPMFFPVHTMPMYSAKFERHINAENIASRGINLPSFPDLTDDELNLIINTCQQFFQG